MRKQKFQRIVLTKPPYDKRDPNPTKNYGIGGLSIYFILKGKKGAVQIFLYIRCYLPSTVKEYKLKNISHDLVGEKLVECYDVGYHSPKARWKGQTFITDCDILKKKCYYDGSATRGEYDQIAEQWSEKGDEFIWKYLEKEYRRVFKR